jgi:tetratricopeptide (TPR) repeat protein
MLSGSRRIAVLLASVLLAGPVRPTLAQPTRQISAKDRQTAGDLVNRAIAMAEAGDHDAAIALYNDAYRIAPDSLMLSNIGAQYQALHQWKEAFDYFCRYLKEDPSGRNAPYATSQAKVVLKKLGKKKINSKDPCATPLDDDDPPPTPVQSTPVQSTEDTDPDAGPGPVKSTPPRPPKPPVDEPAPKAAANGNPMLMYTGLAAGIGGIAAGGIGVYYGIQGKSISDQINSHPKDQPWGNDIRDKQAEGERDNRLQAGFLIASGVLVATGVVLYVIGRPDATEHATDKVVRVAPTGNGVVVFGRF